MHLTPSMHSTNPTIPTASPAHPACPGATAERAGEGIRETGSANDSEPGRPVGRPPDACRDRRGCRRRKTTAVSLDPPDFLESPDELDRKASAEMEVYQHFTSSSHSPHNITTLLPSHMSLQLCLRSTQLSLSLNSAVLPFQEIFAFWAQ